MLKTKRTLRTIGDTIVTEHMSQVPYGLSRIPHHRKSSLSRGIVLSLSASNLILTIIPLDLRGLHTFSFYSIVARYYPPNEITGFLAATSLQTL